jgi:hypothetical protein
VKRHKILSEPQKKVQRAAACAVSMCYDGTIEADV